MEKDSNIFQTEYTSEITLIINLKARDYLFGVTGIFMKEIFQQE
jgi:hypothetical protein